jgi:hypothetical protein
MKGSRTAVVFVASLMLAGCSSGSPRSTGEGLSTAPISTPLPTSDSASPVPVAIRGCVPECSTAAADPGPIGPGPYTTEGFLDGQLTVTYPSSWESHEDQGVEFSSAPRGKWHIHRVLFWDDIKPLVADLHHPYGHEVSGVQNTVRGWLQWLRSNPALAVSTPRSTMIGKIKIPASYVDIAIAPGALSEDPYCAKHLHTTCVALLTWPNAGGNIYSWADPGVLRLYLADVSYGGRRHLLAVAVEGRTLRDLNAFLPAAEMVVASAQAPVEPAHP